MKKLIIEKNKLIDNINKLRSITNSPIIATLKNNGYGLGLNEFPKILEQNGIEFFAVATIEEAIKLRENGITAKIMMLHSTAIESDLLTLLNYDIIPTIGSFEALYVLDKISKENNVPLYAQLKIDTGFGRFGFLPEDMEKLINELKSHPNIGIIGTFSHFSCAFNEKSNYTDKQFNIFNKCVSKLTDAGIEPGIRHICNSSAFLTKLHMHLDTSRIGSALVGRILVQNALGLNKIGYMISAIEDIKMLPINSYVGYSNTYKTKYETKIGIVPVGYLDGLELKKGQDCFDLLGTLREIYSKIKSFNKRIYVEINNKNVPIIGKIGTNNIVIDLTDVDAKVGDIVKLDVNPMMVRPDIERVFE